MQTPKIRTFISPQQSRTTMTKNMAEASVRNRNENTELMQFFSMTVLYLSDLLEKVEAEDKKDKEQKND